LALAWLHFLDDYQLHRRSTKSIAPDEADDEIGFLLLDYPGYGVNQGQPTPKALLDNSLEAFNACTKAISFSSSYRLGFLGHSLGCAANLQLCDHLQTVPSLSARVDRLALLSPFTTLESVAHHLIGPVPFLHYLLHHNYDNLFHSARLVQRVKADQRKLPSVFIAHGSLDRIVPSWMGQQLADLLVSLGVACQFLHLPEADHNDIFAFSSSSLFPFMTGGTEKIDLIT
jgi:acetyl esterase/lipase